MICEEDIKEVMRCIKDERRIGEKSPEERVRKILFRIYRNGYDDGYTEGCDES
jgi:hypothetical protein